MKSKFILLAFLLPFSYACSPDTSTPDNPKEDEEAIRTVLKAEQIAWNNGDIDAFMEGYWKSDSLQFMSLRGIDKGWQATLDSYKKGYPDRAAMGTLSFEILKITPLSDELYVVTGKYHLTRNSDNKDGVFTLIFKKMEGKWVAIYDHTA